MKVIGTAGHIDHGKSTLVKALTGIDPDRLTEEKARGMTIDLGFAWMRLPSGEEVSIVDVPGHERFVKNMLAGAAGIDIALLVVAADELVMPQTREHLAILDLLGVSTGVVALTKADAVDDEWLALGREEVATALAGTRLKGSPIVAVDSISGRGVDDLLRHLESALSRSPSRTDRDLPFLPIDRVFTVAGFGTVTTGTLHGGKLRTGLEVEIIPSGLRGRVRGLQSHSDTVIEAGAGMRVAVNVAGVARDDVRRGDVLALPGTVRAVRTFDARLHVLATAPKALKGGVDLAVHVGAAERVGTLSLVEGDRLEPGAAGWVRIRLQEPAGMVRGQRFIVRLPAPVGTVGGGEVVDVVARSRRRDPNRSSRLHALAERTERDAVLALVAGSRPVSVAQLALTLGTSEERVQPLLDDMVRAAEIMRFGDGYLSADAWRPVSLRALEIVEAYHRAQPLRPGIPGEELRRRVGWSAGQWPAALQRLVQSGVVREVGAHVAAAGFESGAARRPADVSRVMDVLSRTRFNPPTGVELVRETGADSELLAALVADGQVVKIADGVYLSADVYMEGAHVVLDVIRRDGKATVSEVRDILGTTRKYAVALLESLDGRRFTRREGDVRVLGSRSP